MSYSFITLAWPGLAYSGRLSRNLCIVTLFTVCQSMAMDNICVSFSENARKLLLVTDAG